MLKTDLHVHTSEDKVDGDHISYSARELIDIAAAKGYKVISITNHEYVFFNNEIKRYAAKKGILLIPGVEKTVQGKHILLYNITQKQANKIKKVDDLKKLDRKKVLIIAAHPYIPFIGLGRKLVKSIELFDALEHSSFSHNIIDFNRKAKKTAKKYKKTLIGTSDAHDICYFGTTYSLVDSKKDMKSIFNAIKRNKVKIITKHLEHTYFLKRGLSSIYHGIKSRVFLVSEALIHR